MRHDSLAALLLALAGCGEPVEDDHFARDVREARPASAAVATDAVAVRIGELGPNFAACSAAGTPRNLAQGAALPVRSAPFDTAVEVGRIAAGSRFFVCTRSHDQRWLGVVHDAGGALEPRCGVSSPVVSRLAYAGPCRSGWVPAAFVKLVAD
ncbi:MAG TPA: hypothetical protein VGW34_08045 [Allosphingosinicella sp.]|nr:hypothetical protein [Allosphingosinicella sp.]